MKSTVVRLMAISRADFMRLLPLISDVHNSVDDRSNHIDIPSRGVSLELENQPEKQFAALSLPQLKVVIRFANAEASGNRAFLKEFDRIYQRGGG